jgi:hypothetical protein
MSVLSVIREARHRGVKLTADGETLRVQAPAGALDEKLKAALASHKPEILRILNPPRADDGGPAEQCAGCGCPVWWRPAGGTWRCDRCDPRYGTVARVFVVAGGEWSKSA